MNNLKINSYRGGEFVSSKVIALASLEDVVSVRNLIIRNILHGVERIDIYDINGDGFSVFSSSIKGLGRYFYTNKMQSEQSDYLAHVVQALHVKYRTRRPLNCEVRARLEHERGELNCSAFKAIYNEVLKVFNK